MIYLIDDNQADQRTKNYGLYFIENNEFQDILVSIEKIEKGKDLSFLKNATCILLHSTTEDVENGVFVKGSRHNSIFIKEEISSEGEKIPLVLFSNQYDELADYPNERYIRSIKKSKFYERLFDFLTYYKENGKIEFKIIAFGKNFISVEIDNWTKIILSELNSKKESDLLKITNIKLLEFRKIIELSSISQSFDDLIISLEDEPILINKFVENLKLINQSFAKHGKNIYGWIK